MNNNQVLLIEICKMRPVEFAGLAKLLGVDIVRPNEDSSVEEEKKMAPRPFADVLEDVMNKFNKLNRGRKREILKLIKKSNSNKKVEGDFNAGNS